MIKIYRCSESISKAVYTLLSILLVDVKTPEEEINTIKECTEILDNYLDIRTREILNKA